MKKTVSIVFLYLFLIVVGIVIIYPFCWMIGASFNDTYSLQANLSIFPENPSLNGYLNGWKGAGILEYIHLGHISKIHMYMLC